MPTMTNDYSQTDLLATLLAQKYECLSGLHELGRRQAELIETGDIGQLLLLLAEKQRSIGRLQELEQQLNPFRGQEPESRVWRSADTRQQCAGLIERNETLLREILAQERGGEEHLRRRRDETAARLEVVHSAHHARGAYADHGSLARRLDLSSER